MSEVKFSSMANDFMKADNTGVPVWAIVAGSPAEKAGIKIGDKIIAINDIPTMNPIDYWYAFHKTPSLEKKMTIQRGNEIITLTLIYDKNVEIAN